MCETRKLSDNYARPRTSDRKYKTRPQRQSEPSAEGHVDCDADAGFEKVEKRRPRQPRA